jgi:hypothetical protein
MFKIFNGNGVYWIHHFDNLVDAIKDVITCFLIKGSLVMEIEEVVDTGEELLCIEA